MCKVEKTERQFQLTLSEIEQWNQNGYLVRRNVFSPEENNHLYQVAEDIVNDKRPFPSAHFDRNALVKEGKAHGDGRAECGRKPGVFPSSQRFRMKSLCPE